MAAAGRQEDARHTQGGQFGDQNVQVINLSPGSPAVARKAVWLPSQRPAVLGREEVLAELRRGLTEDAAGGVRRRVLVGPGGVGKSSVAAEYAYRHLDAGDYALVWWLPAEEPTAVGPVLARLLADQLDITDTGGDPMAAAHAVLAARTDPWLVIFDNVARPADLDGMLPPAGPGHVLITSRNPNWAPAERVGIAELATGPAAQFLLTRTGGAGEIDEQAARELAGEVGGLPLALEQATTTTTTDDLVVTPSHPPARPHANQDDASESPTSGVAGQRKSPEGHLFISYAREDGDKIHTFIRLLQEKGHDVWVDTAGTLGGRDWSLQVIQAIKTARSLLLMISKASMQSAAVRKEVLYAEKQQVTIIPILLEPLAALPDWYSFHLEYLHRIDASGRRAHKRAVSEIIAALPK